MSKLFTFLKESDSESIRRSHRRRAKEIAVSMSKQTSENKNAPTRHDVVKTIGSTDSGVKDNRPGCGPVSDTDGRRTAAVVGKLYVPSVDGGGYSAGPNGLIIATVCKAW